MKSRHEGIESRAGDGNLDTTRKHAAELAALVPDVILSTGGPATERLLQATRTVPIVFVIVPDPVGSGLVNSLSRPDGNATGFLQFEYSLSANGCSCSKEILPGMTRAVMVRDPGITAGIGQFAVIQSVAPSLGVDVIPINVTDRGEMSAPLPRSEKSMRST